MPRRLTHEEFISKLNKVNSNITVLNLYEYSHNYISVKCTICDNTWKTLPRNLLTGYGCPYCCKTRKVTHEEFINRISIVNPNIEILNEYVRMKNKVLTKCVICNHTWLASPAHLLNKRGCPQCAWKSRSTKWLVGQDVFVKKITSNNPNLIVLGKYERMDKKIKLKCRKCALEWEVIARDVYYSFYGCPCCKESKGERKIKLFLKEENISFIPQKRFPDCIDKRTLPFDFYLPNHNICIEYDGKHHFKETGFYKGRDLAYVVNHDRIKTEYCIKNNIKLIRITYKDEINEELKKLSNISL